MKRISMLILRPYDIGLTILEDLVEILTITEEDI